ncbi:hypothetical protein Adeg_2003 [Ammonifex degensii KC4]|uniref:Uncharacterized protein n=1 Tax=Ammonifex degensii (strain DSM 10501 / KC4) TaxID=429009 RepID=C9R9V2_AMMDK|nr:hypothetical protein [Ammonifex degensii]ACX53081.1 hypothetical protein Adeg_2003 [Ammonifex degensii KC4]
MLGARLYTYPARVVAREEPLRDPLREAIARRLGLPPVERVLVPVRCGRVRRVVLEELAQAVLDVVEGQLTVEGLLARYGNFFGGPVAEREAARRLLGLFFLLATRLLLERRPPAVFWIERWVLGPFKRYAEGVPEEERLAVAVREGEGVVLGGPGERAFTVVDMVNFLPVWVPAGEGDWPVFHLPQEWPTTREEITRYAQAQLQAHAPFVSFRAEWRDGVLEVQPSSLVDGLLLYLCAKEVRIEVGKKRLSTYDRRVVEDYFHVYRRRGKITEEECRKAIAAVKQAWRRGKRDRAALREIGWRAIREDF